MTTNMMPTGNYPLTRFDLEMPLHDLRRTLGDTNTHVHRMTTEVLDFLDAFLDARFTMGLDAVPIHNLGLAFDDHFAVRAHGTIDNQTVVVYIFVNTAADKPHLSWDFDDDTAANPQTIEKVRQCLFDAIRTAAILTPADALA